MAAGGPPTLLSSSWNQWVSSSLFLETSGASESWCPHFPSFHWCIISRVKKEGRLEGFAKKKWVTTQTFCKGKIARKRDLGGVKGVWLCPAVWRLFQLKPGAGIRGSVQTVTFSSCWLFCSLGPEPQQIGAYLLFTLGRGSSLISLLATHSREAIDKGVPATWRGREKNCRDYFLIQKPHWCESFPRPSEVTWSLNMMTGFFLNSNMVLLFSKPKSLLLWACGLRSLKNGHS